MTAISTHHQKSLALILQVTVEQQALEDYLLLEPALKAAATQLLPERLAAPDIVTQVLSQLGSKPPQELWSLMHSEAPPAGKPAKAAPAKGAAAAKSKPGMPDAACQPYGSASGTISVTCSVMRCWIHQHTRPVCDLHQDWLHM